MSAELEKALDPLRALFAERQKEVRDAMEMFDRLKEHAEKLEEELKKHPNPHELSQWRVRALDAERRLASVHELLVENPRP